MRNRRIGSNPIHGVNTISNNEKDENSKDLTTELACTGAPESVIERFTNADTPFDGDVDEIVKEYRSDVLNPEVDSEEPFKEAIEDLS